MNQSNNVMDGALAFNFKVKTQEDGRTTVSVPTQPQLPPVTHEKRSMAVELMKQRVQQAAGKAGGLKSK